MLSNYIKKLLDIHSRVIVPDLGAFMLKGDSTVYFNEFLRFNDGVLVDYVAEQDKTDKTEAAKKIQSFVDQINKQLGNGESVDLENLGSLYMDSNEKVQLRTAGNATTPEIKEKTADVVTESREVEFDMTPTSPVPEDNITKPEPPVPKEKKVSPKVPETKPEPKPEPKVIPPVEEKKIRTVPEKEPPVTINRKSGSGRAVLVVAAGIIFLAAGLYFILFHSSKKGAFKQNITIGSEVKDTTSANRVQTPEPVAEKTTASESSKTPVKKDQAKTVPDNKKKISVIPEKPRKTTSVAKDNGQKYFLIAGSFTVEANATRMVNTLKSEGRDPRKIYNVEKQVYYVSVASFPDRSSAVEEMKKLKEQGQSTWIYFH